MSQLFITPYEKLENTITISDPEIVNQCKKVLRMEAGRQISIQENGESQTTRYTIEITELKATIKGSIISQWSQTKANRQSIIAVAMPNKRDKIELIVQKLSEIWIDQIIFWPSERSIIKEWNTKKAERLSKIAKEATEQSRNRFLPEIKFSTTPIITDDTEYIIFDKQDWAEKQFKTQNSKPNICWIVGPEWWLTTKDYSIRKDTPHHVQLLGDGVLRTETWAIIWGWLIKNMK